MRLLRKKHELLYQNVGEGVSIDMEIRFSLIIGQMKISIPRWWIVRYHLTKNQLDIHGISIIKCIFVILNYYMEMVEGMGCFIHWFTISKPEPENKSSEMNEKEYLIAWTVH